MCPPDTIPAVHLRSLHGTAEGLTAHACTRAHSVPVNFGQAASGMQVLTTGSWPTQTAPKCTLPREVDEACTRFRDFYLSTHSGRKLSWQTNMGNAGGSPPKYNRCA